MNRRFMSLATFACLVAFVRHVAITIVSIARYMIHAVAAPAAFAWNRLALPKVTDFKIISCLKRVYRESWLTTGQSLRHRHFIHC